MRCQLNRKINRIEEKLSAVAGKTEVIFLMPGEDLAEAKKQRYGNDLPDDAQVLVVSFRSSQDDLCSSKTPQSRKFVIIITEPRTAFLPVPRGMEIRSA